MSIVSNMKRLGLALSAITLLSSTVALAELGGEAAFYPATTFGPLAFKPTYQQVEIAKHAAFAVSREAKSLAVNAYPSFNAADARATGLLERVSFKAKELGRQLHTAADVYSLPQFFQLKKAACHDTKELLQLTNASRHEAEFANDERLRPFQFEVLERRLYSIREDLSCHHF